MVQPALPLIPGPKPSKAKRIVVEPQPHVNDREEAPQIALNGEAVQADPLSEAKISLAENVHNGSSDNLNGFSPAGQQMSPQPFAI